MADADTLEQTEELLQQVSAIIEENKSTLQQSRQTVHELHQLIVSSKALLDKVTATQSNRAVIE
jgi:hypothetical protein